MIVYVDWISVMQAGLYRFSILIKIARQLMKIVTSLPVRSKRNEIIHYLIYVASSLPQMGLKVERMGEIVGGQQLFPTTKTMPI